MMIGLPEDEMLHVLHSRPHEADLPTFVFINPLLGSTDLWEAQIAPALRGAGAGTLSFDFRGQGGSHHLATRELTEAVLVEDLLTVMAAEQPGRPVLVGLSVGGLFAARAIERGAACDGLVLINTLRRSMPRIDWVNDAFPRLVAFGGARLFQDAMLPMLVGPAHLQRLRPQFLGGTYAAPGPDDPALNLVRNAASAAWDFDWSGLDVPALVLSGRHDRVFFDEAVVEGIVAIMPHAEAEVWEDCGHLLPLESPDAFCDRVLAFAGDLNPVARTQDR